MPQQRKRRMQGQTDMADIGGASRISRVQARENDRPNIAGMMSFDHMDPAQVTQWKKDYSKWRGGLKKKADLQQEQRDTAARRNRRGY
jgi:hypothetical protein